MRLVVVFFVVLAAAAIITSMAAWGITYGTSYDRVSTMASQFTALAQASFIGFGSFIADLLRSNAALVDAILEAQEASGQNRTQQTQVQMAQTIGILVNYTTNSTQQTQRQVGGVVSAFDALMATVVTEFRGMADMYVARIRRDVSARLMAMQSSYVVTEFALMKNVQHLIDLGLLDLSRAPTDPVNVEDCNLLALLCDTSNDFYGLEFSISSVTGRYYVCSQLDGAAVSTRNYSGGVYNESLWRWLPSSSTVPMKKRCLSEVPAVEPVGLGCSPAQSCRCGRDQRCTPWFQSLANATSSYFMYGVYDDSGVPWVNTFFTLVNLTASPPALLGVVGLRQSLFISQYTLPAALDLDSATSMAMVLNDTGLSNLGSNARKCTPNETMPGDPALPWYSALRACDPGLRAVAQWLAANRSQTQMVTLDVQDMLWDVSTQQIAGLSYFFFVGTNKSEAYQAIDATQATANGLLAATRAKVLADVAASGAATQAYMAFLGAQNIQATQAMQDRFQEQVAALGAAAHASLLDSQARTSVGAGALMVNQTTAVEAQKTSALHTMGITAGWTVAVVFSLLLGVLCLSAWGTIRMTKTLTQIIALMEDVADLRVEHLTIPQGSSVQEVTRIQTAFQVMVARLTEYKGYIPAGVFEQLALPPRADTGSDDGRASDLSDTSSRQSSCTSLSGQPLGTSRQHSYQVSPVALPHPHWGAGRRSAAKQAAVLAVNVVGFMDLLLASKECLSKTIFNDYITQIHEVVSQNRGNIDFLSGDQVFATFNAHVPCGDPAGSASAAALDLQTELLPKLGNRMRFQIGVSFGPVMASTVGYIKFKFMVTVGSPMKVAAILSHREGLESGSILVDSALQERVKYSFDFQPVELLYLPRVKSLNLGTSTSQRAFVLRKKKKLQVDEWLYQLVDGADSSDWSKTFERLVAAPSTAEMQRRLEDYLTKYPTDDLALRLRDRVSEWTPGKGIAV
eukprot:EG_transcript_1109